MTVQDEKDAELVRSAKERKAEDPNYWPTPEELAVIKQVTSDEAAPPPRTEGVGEQLSQKV